MKQISFKTLQNGLAQWPKRLLSAGSISAILLLSACGQRGPLYHPEPPPPISKGNTEPSPSNTPGNTPNSTQKSTKQ
ncbi:MAG: lipoprotein [Limnobacter sp.]|nr:lipoprotein [Limnobacter sp.]